MKTVFSLTAMLACVAALTAADPKAVDYWPAWRGPSGTGVAPEGANPPVTWDAKTNIKWKVELPSRGSATPVVWGDQVFVLTGTKTDRLAKLEERPKPDERFSKNKTEPPTHFYKFEVHSFDRQTGK
jgi:hypothetical protein